jgi:nitrite reductase/ring-hydroxylating ferredoxin subunit
MTGLLGCGGTSKMIQMLSGFRISGEKLFLELAAAPALVPVGGAVKLKLDTNPDKISVVHVADDQYLAFVNRCTHRSSAELDYKHEERAFVCSSCHGGRFDLAGSVANPPPKEPLRMLPVKLVDKTLEISLA